MALPEQQKAGLWGAQCEAHCQPDLHAKAVHAPPSPLSFTLPHRVRNVMSNESVDLSTVSLQYWLQVWVERWP